MGKKSFIVMLAILAATIAATTLIGHFQAKAVASVNLSLMPLQIGEWTGHSETLPSSIVTLLSPDQLFTAQYTDAQGSAIDFFVDYFSPGNRAGAIHSPRNCLPGSGWVIEKSEARPISIGGRKISASRFYLRQGDSRQVMDFWYITRIGETANDYILKFNTMLSSLTLRPTDKAFIRFVAPNTPGGLTALDKFEGAFIGEIYRRLPFGQVSGPTSLPD